MWVPEQKLLLCSAPNKATLSLNKTTARNASYCFGSEQADLCIGMKEGFFDFFFFLKSNFLLDIFYRGVLQGSWHARLLVVGINESTLVSSFKAAGFFPLPDYQKTEFSGKASGCRVLFRQSILQYEVVLLQVAAPGVK